jgi:epoxide hydrolase 4
VIDRGGDLSEELRNGVIRAPLRFSYRVVNGLTLHVAEAGPEDGRVVVLLHGFPEFWYGWRHQFDALVDAGYRVLAPDQRGYNLSARPKGVAAYDLDVLADDIVSLADSFGIHEFSLIGHDWGGLVAWWIAAHHPDRLTGYVTLAAPHPSVWVDAMRNHPAQRRKSWYVRAFRLPWLPEQLLRQQNFKALVDALQTDARPDACSTADIEIYRAAWSMPGTLSAMLNWYRAILVKRLDLAQAGRITVPGLVIWGNNDKFGIPELVPRSIALCARTEAVHLDTSHWIQHDAPERVNALLLNFLRACEAA